MARWLDLLWRLFGILGWILSLRRWWRTLTDAEQPKERRLLAGAILLGGVLLMVWTLVSFGSPLADRSPAHPVQLVVDLRDDLPPAQLADLEADYGLDLRLNSPQAVEEQLTVAETRLTPVQLRRLLRRLNRDPRVEAADENFTMGLLGAAAPAGFTPNDPRYREQWNFRLIGMEAAWEKATGKGVTVAVIDTGVAFEKEKDIPVASDLRQTKWTKPYDFVGHRAKAYDDHGHGTHCAGTIAQSTNNGHGVAGIAYNATIMPLKVLSAAGSGTIADIADAITYAADNGAQVISMSLGGPRGSAVLARALRYAHQRGVVIVAAAGNTGTEGVCYPAAYPECIAVSAVGPSGELTFYSTWGKEIALAAPGGEFRSPDARADGVLQNTVFQKQDTFEFWQGTSMATPHVAGVAALLIEQGLQGPAAVRDRLRRTATPKGDELKYGAGLLNAAAAVGAQTQTLAAAPAPVRSLWLALVLCAFWPLLVVGLTYGIRPIRPVLGAAVTAFGLTALVVAVRGAGPGLWLVANGLVSLGLAWLVGRRD